MKQPRVAPLAPDELSEQQASFLRPFTNKHGQYPNVFGTLVRHLELAKAWSPFGLYTLNGNQIDPLEREVLILRTAVLIGSDYEWHQHRKIALRLGMPDATLEQIKQGLSDEPGYQLLIQCADELIRQHRISDATWQQLVERYDLSYVLDAVFTVGAYSTLGMALNSCGVEIEPAEADRGR